MALRWPVKIAGKKSLMLRRATHTQNGGSTIEFKPKVGQGEGSLWHTVTVNMHICWTGQGDDPWDDLWRLQAERVWCWDVRHMYTCTDTHKTGSTRWCQTQTLICQSFGPNFFFSLRQFFLSLFLKKKIFFSQNFFFWNSRCKMKFGKNFCNPASSLQTESWAPQLS
jgi:hypothetical protein